MSDAITWIRVLPGLFAAAVGLGAAAAWQRYARSPLALQAVGATTWAISVALKVAWAIPMNPPVHHAIRSLFGARASEPVYWLYVGVLTGVFEVGATFAVVRFTRLRDAHPAEAVAFGVGFGAAEALVLGVLAVLPVALLLVAPSALPPAVKEAIARTHGAPLDLGALLIPSLERTSALVFHVVTCALVVHGFRVGRGDASPSRGAVIGIWFALAFVYKSAIDGFAAWASLSLGVGSDGAKLAWFEASLAVFALASGVLLRRHLSKSARHRGVALAAPTPFGA